MRLNAFMADCGVASRRKSEALILGGKIRVNNKIILAPYFTIDPDKDLVEYDGKLLKFLPKTYFVMNKPKGVVCAVTDKYDPVVVDLLPVKTKELRVFPVGRLDRDSEGLLILTNDGLFAQSVQHPSKGVTKEYEVLLNMEINGKQMARWKAGFEIEGRRARPLAIEVISREPHGRWVRVVIGEGLKREVRTMAKLTGFNVLALIRRKIGGLILEKLQVGEFLELSFSDLCSRIFQGGAV
jgi:23S rRNA pseudouridine2605 synthase